MSMKITMVQARGFVDDPMTNFFKARMRVNNVDSDIFVYPEMYCSGYVPEVKRMQPDKTTDMVVNNMKTMAGKRNCGIVFDAPRIIDGKLYNCVLFAGPDGIVTHKKTVPTTDGVFDETDIFEWGDATTMFDFRGLKIGLCTGQELCTHIIPRRYAENGADIVIAVAAFTEEQMARTEKIAVARAVENKIYVMLVNMVGEDPGKKMGGKSMFITPDGEIAERFSDSTDLREIRLEDNFLDAVAGRSPIPEPKLRS